MSSRVCVFVDGENFRHNIVDLFESFERKDYLPKGANWEGLFDWLVAEVEPDGQRVRTYWYVVRHLDFFPYRFPRLDRKPDVLKNVLCSNDSIRDELKLLEGDDLTTRMQELVQKLSERRNTMEQRFRWWTSV